MAIWSRTGEKEKFYVVEGMVESFRGLEPDAHTANRISEVMSGAILRGSGQVATKAEIERLVTVSDNLDAMRRRTMVHKDNWAEIMEDLEKGMMIEEIIPDEVEMIESDEGTEEVIYVGGKVQSVYTPKKERGKAIKAFWRMLKPIQEGEKEGEDGGDQEEIMFGHINLQSPEGSGAATPTQRGKGKKKEGDKQHMTVRATLEGASVALNQGEDRWAADKPEFEETYHGWGGEGQLGPRGFETPVTPPKKESRAQEMKRRMIKFTLGSEVNPVVASQTADHKGDGETEMLEAPEGKKGFEHPWEQEIEIDMAMGGLESVLEVTKQDTLEPKLNKSRHAPPEHSKAQIDLSKKLTSEILEKQDRKSTRLNSSHVD